MNDKTGKVIRTLLKMTAVYRQVSFYARVTFQKNVFLENITQIKHKIPI